MTIKEIRKAAGLTQAALAARFGIPRRTIENWEGGVNTPPDYVVRMIAELLGIKE